MKTNWLIILFIFLSTSAFNIDSSLEMQSPSIKIQTESSLPAFVGEMIIYKIEFFSKDILKSLSIKPSIIGANNDSKMLYEFEEGLHRAVISYFYVVPDNITTEIITIEFSLTDANGTQVIKKNIIVKK